MNVASEPITAKILGGIKKTLYGLMHDIRVFILGCHLRVLKYRLHLEMGDAYFRLGKKAFEAGLGNASLSAKIESLTRSIELLIAPKSSTEHSRAERRLLTIQMGKEVAAASTNAVIAAEAAVVRDLAAREELLLARIGALNASATDGQSWRTHMVISIFVLLTATAVYVTTGSFSGGATRQNERPADEIKVAHAESAVTAKHRLEATAGADKGQATRAYLYQFYSRNAAFTTDLRDPYKITRESTDLTALENAYRHMARLSADEAAVLRRLDPSNVDLRVGKWALDWAAFLRRSSLHYATYANLMAESRNLQTYYSSGEGMVESVIRGADGDPFGTARDSIAHKHRLQRDFEDLRKADQEFAKEEAEHMATGDALKLYLLETYPGAFGQ